MQIKELLESAVKANASDLHISPTQSIRMRVDGELMAFDEQTILDADTTKKLIFSVMDINDQRLFEKELELDFIVRFSGVGRFRVNAFYEKNGIGAVFRVIPENVPSLQSLNLPTIFQELLHQPHGLILVTGPTGSGKSTTLAAMIDYINQSESSHIITIEDPIEFSHTSKKSLINQRQVKRDTLDFTTALRSVLRQDPDVILVGEMRDLETIRLALTAAETGHLVLATLHTSSAARAVSRIVDVFPAGEKNIIRNMLAESLNAVICQTLVKRKDTGRVPAFEIMIGTSAIRNLIREDKIPQMYSVIQTGSEKGMRTLDQYLKKLIEDQIIDKEAARHLLVYKEGVL